jgi:hypothetical protein
MKDLTEAELAEKYPHGWAIEIKKRRLADGTVKEYVCRRKKKAPAGSAGGKRKQTAVTREIKQKIQEIPLRQRHKVLEALEKLAYSDSESDSEE